MADLVDIHSDGKWDFKTVASTLLKLTTLFDPNTNINYTAGPNLKPTHDVQYWTAKTRNFDSSGEDRVPSELHNKFLWEGLKAQLEPLGLSRLHNRDEESVYGRDKRRSLLD